MGGLREQDVSSEKTGGYPYPCPRSSKNCPKDNEKICSSCLETCFKCSRINHVVCGSGKKHCWCGGPGQGPDPLCPWPPA